MCVNADCKKPFLGGALSSVVGVGVRFCSPHTAAALLTPNHNQGATNEPS